MVFSMSSLGCHVETLCVSLLMLLGDTITQERGTIFVPLSWQHYPSIRPCQRTAWHNNPTVLVMAHIPWQ